MDFSVVHGVPANATFFFISVDYQGVLLLIQVWSALLYVTHENFNDTTFYHKIKFTVCWI
jgi:hypothetical protein